MMTPELLLIAALATYRWTLLVNKEDGPADIFGRFRSWMGVTYDQYSNPVATNGRAEALLCPYCLSVWVGIVMTALLVLALALHLETVLFYALLPFALSGAAVFWFKWTGV
jgi:hypothetical protein